MATLASITIDSQTFNLKSLLNYLFIIFFYYLKYTLNTENSLADLNLFYSFCCSYFLCTFKHIHLESRPALRSSDVPKCQYPLHYQLLSRPRLRSLLRMCARLRHALRHGRGRQQALSASVLSISATPHRGGALGAVPLALRRLGNAYARIMEPFVGAGVIVTGHHVAIGHLVAGAITWLIGII